MVYKKHALTWKNTQNCDAQYRQNLLGVSMSGTNFTEEDNSKPQKSMLT